MSSRSRNAQSAAMLTFASGDVAAFGQLSVSNIHSGISTGTGPPTSLLQQKTRTPPRIKAALTMTSRLCHGCHL